MNEIKKEILQKSGLNEEIFYQQLNEGIQFFKDSGQFTSVLRKLKSLEDQVKDAKVKAYINKVYSYLDTTRKQLVSLEQKYRDTEDKLERKKLKNQHMKVRNRGKQIESNFKQDFDRILKEVAKDREGGILKDEVFLASVSALVVATSLFMILTYFYSQIAFPDGMQSVMQTMDSFASGASESPLPSTFGARALSTGMQITGGLGVISNIIARIRLKTLDRARVKKALSMLSNKIPGIVPITSKTISVIDRASSKIV